MKKLFIVSAVVVGLVYAIWWGNKHLDFSFQSPPPETEEHWCSKLGNIDMRYLPAKCLRYFLAVTPKE